MRKQEANHKGEESAGITRPPVVVVLGHVDHGKSSLLEAIREEFRITAKEAGGITQHIGAYEVEVPQEPTSRASEASRGILRRAQDDFASGGRKITFIDTPGHEAFSAMRSRGAKVADIALLVIAADEGIKAQTEEALAQIQKAGLPFVAVFSKMDKAGANAERVKQELLQKGAQVESLGGKVPTAAVSASTKEGIPELLELVLLMAEMEELQDAPKLSAHGVVIESFMDAKRGPAATLLVRQGGVKAGDSIATPTSSGKVRILENFQGVQLEEARASQPALVIGFGASPFVGEEFRVFSTKEEAEEFASQERKREREAAGEETAVLPLVLKADTVGALEALEHMLGQLPQEEVRLRIVGAGAGDVGESDIRLAQGAKALVVAFRSRVSSEMQELGERLGVAILQRDVIYEAFQDIEEALEARKEPVSDREEKGEARVLALFRSKGKEQIVGGRLTAGEARVGMAVEAFRGEELLGEGTVKNLQRNKEEVSFVPAGEEFGMLFAGEPKLQEQDTLKFYTIREQ